MFWDFVYGFLDFASVFCCSGLAEIHGFDLHLFSDLQVFVFVTNKP